MLRDRLHAAAVRNGVAPLTSLRDDPAVVEETVRADPWALDARASRAREKKSTLTTVGNNTLEFCDSEIPRTRILSTH